MSLAKLVTRPSDARYGGHKSISVDCEHGETTIAVIQPVGAPTVSEQTVIATAVARHYLEEGCRCTRKLRLQYLTRRMA
jgi:hypothetical protein